MGACWWSIDESREDSVLAVPMTMRGMITLSPSSVMIRLRSRTNSPAAIQSWLPPGRARRRAGRSPFVVVRCVAASCLLRRVEPDGSRKKTCCCCSWGSRQLISVGLAPAGSQLSGYTMPPATRLSDFRRACPGGITTEWLQAQEAAAKNRYADGPETGLVMMASCLCWKARGNSRLSAAIRLIPVMTAWTTAFGVA
jgi:hypothetical protein